MKRLTCCNILGSENPSEKKLVLKILFVNSLRLNSNGWSQLRLCSSLKVCLKVFDWANRFHLAVGLYSDIVQGTSKRGKNIRHATHLRLVAYFFVLITF